MRYFKCSFQWDKKINIFVQMRMPRPILGIDNRLSTAFEMYTFRAQFKWNYKQIFEQIYPASGIHGADTTKENDRIIKSESKCRQTCTETTTDRNEWKKTNQISIFVVLVKMCLPENCLYPPRILCFHHLTMLPAIVNFVASYSIFAPIICAFLYVPKTELGIVRVCCGG